MLTDNEFTEVKYIENLINFIYVLIISKLDAFIPDLDKCIELFINQVFHNLIINLKNENIIKTTNDILIVTLLKLNPENFP